MSRNGLNVGTSDKDIPGTLNDWQKYCTFGVRPKVNINLFG